MSICPSHFTAKVSWNYKFFTADLNKINKFFIILRQNLDILRLCAYNLLKYWGISILLDYSGFSDEELHRCYRAGDADAGNELALRYRRLVRCCIRPYFLAGGDSEDLLQEGMIGLLTAMRDYVPGSSSFSTYAARCIRHRVISAARAASRQKHAPLNQGVPLDDFLSGEEQHASLYPGRSAEEQVLDQEWKHEFLSAYSKYLSGFESRILADYLDGLAYHEIATNCGRSPKSVDNAIQRIRKKLARHITISGDFS